MRISPGLVDLQVNGFAGVDFNSGAITADQMDVALEAMLATGVTLCLPTLITAYPHELVARFRALDAAVSASRLGPAMCPGYHLEGPFLNPTQGYAGCHPPDAMTAARSELVKQLQTDLSRPILLVTVAAEIEGALPLIETLASSGSIIALGHSAANFEQVAAAADAGATMSTHLGNGLPQTMHKLANPLFAQLAEDRMWASFIADGIHLHPKALQSLIRAKGLAHSILVTDAVAGAAARQGRYTLGSMVIERYPDGSVRQLDGLLAGSALCLDEAVRNLVSWGLASFEDAAAMASTHALAVLAPALQAHGITVEPGEVAWSDDLAVRHVKMGALERRFGS